MITALTDELEDLERELALELEGLELDNDVQVDEEKLEEEINSMLSS